MTTTPTTPGANPTPGDSTLISSLMATARARFASECPDQDSDELIGATDDRARCIADHPAARGVAQRSGSRNASAHRPFQVLELSSKTARLHTVGGPTTIGCLTLVDSVDLDDDEPDRRGHLHRGEPSHRTNRHLDRYLRAVEDDA